MLQKIDGIKQSDKYGFYLLTDDNVWDVTKVSENFQEIEDIIKNFALDDEHIEVLSKNKKLNIVISNLEDKDIELEKNNKELIALIIEYKKAMDAYFKDLGTEVKRHEAANKKLEEYL